MRGNEAQKVKILLVGILVALVLLPIIIPEFLHARSVAHMNSCINHLAQIDGAKQTWAQKNHKNANDVPTWNDLRPYFGRGSDFTTLVCPDGGTYTLGSLSEAPKCSIRGHVLN
jgi:hypothetical protein